MKIYENLCKGCRLCIDVCPKKVLQISTKRGKQGYLIPEVTNNDSCTMCRQCEYTCPDMAIEVMG
ncbi:4Fe-4S dicluster domain-containing protein [Thermanaerosceptrum fracticalcis]|uniref:4Fe-4S dicluster domain-containing protein n=1 Tax=Thermanaerosceptrum fracticalcis TaxID=1712410 RepID=A0A7G6E8M5_THEFR|nr:4Fe-4S dicluster domain-containing protein [Thermanaerosceptrum fracticalcis]